METTKSSFFTKFLFAFLIISLLGAIGLSFYRYYYQKDYNYLVEASCDPITEKCFARDCSNPDDCPPNQFSSYKEYYVKAYDFPRCADNSCAATCASGDIKCESVPCDKKEGDVCEGPALSGGPE